MAMSVGNAGLGFGLAFSLEDQFTAVSTRIRQSMKGLEGDTDTLQNQLDQSMREIATGASVLAAGLAGLAPMVQAVTDFATLDGLEKGLAAVAGGSEQAAIQLERLKEVAKLPGLGFQEAIQGSINLQAAGLSADLAERSLKAFGNALATVGRGKAYLDGVNLALGQIASKGKISAEEINQLAERVPQIRQVMQAAFGTADTEALQKAGIGATVFIDSIVQELEKLPPVAGGIGTAFENFTDAMFRLSASIGRAVAPAVEFLADKLAMVAAALEAFSANPVGRFVIGLTVALASLAVVMGTITMLSGFMRLGLYKVAESFGEVTFMAVLSATTAKKGFAAGLIQLGRSMMATMAPVALIAVKVALVVGAFYALYSIVSKAVKMYEEFGQTGSAFPLQAQVKGIEAFMLRLGAFINLIQEVWTTWDGTFFTLTAETEAKLKSLGIYEVALAVATWTLRIKEFLGGLVQGITLVAGYVKEALLNAWQFVSNGIGAVLDKLGISLDRNTSAVYQWAEAGKIAGIGLAVILGLLAVKAAVAAASMVIAFAPFLLTIAAVAAGLYLLYNVFTSLYEIGAMVVSGLISLFDMLAEKLTAVFDYFQERWQGFKDTFSGIIGNFTGTVNSEAVQPSLAPLQNTVGTQAAAMRSTGANSTITNNNTTTQSTPVVTQLYVDGSKVLESLNNRAAIEDSRY